MATGVSVFITTTERVVYLSVYNYSCDVSKENSSALLTSAKKV